MTNLSDYYFLYPELFVIPIEHLSPQGMSDEFRELLGRRVRLPKGWSDLFNQGFAAYWERTTDLATRAPLHWFPPRLQHCCIVVDAARLRPYFQPFNKCSWLLYTNDFDPAVSNIEFAAYQFVHAERMGLLQEVTQTVVRNLAYWLVRSDAEIDRFCGACRTSSRLDGAAFQALAEAMPWVRRLYHESIKPLQLFSAEPYVTLPHTGVLMRRSVQPQLDKLTRTWTVVARTAMDGFYAAHARRGRDHAGDLCAWLRDRRPRVLIAGERGRALWDPEVPDRLGAVRTALRGTSESVAASLREDVSIIDARSRAFLESVRHSERLPVVPTGMAQSGLSYLDPQRRLVAYNLREPGMDRLRVPAPPYERLMLAARTSHEWGHLAADAGWVQIAPNCHHEHQSLVQEVGTLFDEIYRGAPQPFRDHTASDMARLVQEGQRPGDALARLSLGRLSDYQANLLARCYLRAEELETYIRNNVYTLSLEYPSTALFRRLARYVYEYQYLRFSPISDARTYFVCSTWFSNEYLRPRVLTEDQLERLLATLGKLLACYVVDWSHFTQEFAAQKSSGGRV